MPQSPSIGGTACCCFVGRCIHNNFSPFRKDLSNKTVSSHLWGDHKASRISHYDMKWRVCRPRLRFIGMGSDVVMAIFIARHNPMVLRTPFFHLSYKFPHTWVLLGVHGKGCRKDCMLPSSIFVCIIEICFLLKPNLVPLQGVATVLQSFMIPAYDFCFGVNHPAIWLLYLPNFSRQKFFESFIDQLFTVGENKAKVVLLVFEGNPVNVFCQNLSITQPLVARMWHGISESLRSVWERGWNQWLSWCLRLLVCVMLCPEVSGQEASHPPRPTHSSTYNSSVGSSGSR